MGKPSVTSTPVVSVLMPVYNCIGTIAEAVDSVLSQTFGDLELVIVNDGSTDGSMDVVRSVNDSRILILDNEKNLGLAESLNRGIAACRGKYVARMDGDDVSAPERLEKQVAFMDKNPTVGLCGTWARTIDAQGRVTGRSKNLTHDAELKINLLFSIPFFHSSVMIRAALLKENLYDTGFPQAQDYELWTRLAGKTRVANISRYLLDYRWHESNISVRETGRQEEKKREVLRRQLGKLGINPSPEELELHQAAFGREFSRDVTPSALSAWYVRLIEANRAAQIYNRPMLRAYLWSRYAVFCKVNGCMPKGLFPRFASLNPVVLFYLVRFLSHFAGKKV